jgi:hypothetical protein
MEQDLKKFLTALSRDENSSLMENVLKGYSCIFEGYADVRDEYVADATTMFNQRAAFNSSMDGNNILSFLQRSSEQLAGKYSDDLEPELDNNGTSDFRGGNFERQADLDVSSQVDASDYNHPQRFEDSLGLSASDLQELGL